MEEYFKDLYNCTISKIILGSGEWYWEIHHKESNEILHALNYTETVKIAKLLNLKYQTVIALDIERGL